MRIPQISTTFVSLLLGGALLGAREPPAADAFGEAIEVREILLEVQALDRQGRPVDGLGRGDFAVTLGGVAAEVTSVRQVGPRAAVNPAPGEPAAEGGESPAATGDPLRLVVFVDNVHVAATSRRRALLDLQAFLEGTLREGDEAMVVTYQDRLEIRQPFTSDHDRIAEALVAAEELTAHRLFGGSEELRVMEQIYEVQFMMLQGRADPCTLIEGLALNFATERYQSMERMIDSMGRFVDSLSGIPGRKAIVHVSDGIPLVAGRGAYEYVIELCNGIGVAKGVAAAVDLSSDPHDHTNSIKLGLDLHRFDLSSRWSALAARSNRQNVTFFTVQASGVGEDTSAGSTVRLGSLETATSRRQNEQDTLVLLAEETGGRAILNHNRLAPALDRVAEELRSYYAVSVRPTMAVPTGRVLTVKVDAAPPTVETRHRRSLIFKSRQQEIADQVLSSVLHEVDDNPWGLRAEVVEQAAVAGGRSRVRLRIEIPLGALTLLPTGPTAQGMFTVFLAARDAEGRTTAVRQSTVPLEVPASDLETARAGTYRYEVEMEMRPGDHVVGVGVLDDLGGDASWVRTRVRL